jgi:hypothetical protein
VDETFAKQKAHFSCKLDLQILNTNVTLYLQNKFGRANTSIRDSSIEVLAYK